MFIAIALGLVGLVVVLHNKAATSNDTTGQTGASNGVDIYKPGTEHLRPSPAAVNGLIGRFGATSIPSPATGAGSPSSSSLIKSIDVMKRYNVTAGGSNAFISQLHPKGTVLNPLPQGKGTQSKQLLTKDVITFPGSKY